MSLMCARTLTQPPVPRRASLKVLQSHHTTLTPRTYHRHPPLAGFPQHHASLTLPLPTYCPSYWLGSGVFSYSLPMPPKLVGIVVLDSSLEESHATAGGAMPSGCASRQAPRRKTTGRSSKIDGYIASYKSTRCNITHSTPSSHLHNQHRPNGA
jgi:hypothetical protein